MGSLQRNNSKVLAISCLVLLLALKLEACEASTNPKYEYSDGEVESQSSITGRQQRVRRLFQPLLLALNLEKTVGCPTRPDGTTRWPELVGKPGCEAAAFIKKENSFFNPIVLPEGTPVTRDFRCDRVWIFIQGRFGLVTSTPVAT